MQHLGTEYAIPSSQGVACRYHRRLPHKQRRHRRWAVVLVALALVALAGCGQKPVAPGELLGSFLTDLSTQIDSTLQQFGDSANSITLQLAGQIRLDLDQAVSAFATQLTKSVNDLDAATKQTLNQLQGLVNDLSSQSQDVLTKATDSAELILSQIPFTDKNPRVTDYSPRFTTAAASAGGLVLTLKGAFAKANEPQYAAVLKVNGVVVDGGKISNTLTELKFKLPSGAFALGSPNIEVDLPFQTGSVFNKRIVPGVFSLFITRLPDSPTKNVFLSTTVPTKAPQAEKKTTEQFGYNSLDCNPHAASPTIQPPAASPGEPAWTIDTTQLHFNIVDGYPKGPSGTVTGPNWTAISPSAVTFSVLTTPACFWPIIEGGRTFFTVSYVIVRTVDGRPAVRNCDQHSAGNGCPNLSLQWGGSLDVPVPQRPGNWQLVVTLFDGTSITAGPGATTNNPWVKITDLGTHVNVSAMPLAKMAASTLSASGTQSSQ